MTVREFLTKTFQLAGIIASNETLSASEANDGLVSFNELLESWSIEGLMVPIYDVEFTLTPGSSQYAIGPDSNAITGAILIDLKSASVISNNIEYPVDIITSKQWAEIPDKTISGMPTKCYAQKGDQRDTYLNFYPVPSESDNLKIYGEFAIASISTLDSTLTLPIGFQRALRYNLAVDIAPEYGQELSQTIMSTAFNLKADLKRQNNEPVYLKSDYTQVGRKFNILTGE
jgi:hypothetical protein